MAIAYQAISTLVTKTTTVAGSLTLTEPAGATTNDLLVACISFRGGTTPSIPATWNLINRTSAAGNTNTNQNAVGSGLMAWIKRGAAAPDLIFGATAGQQFPDLAFGYVLRLNGQELNASPLAGTSQNTLAAGASGTVTTGGYTRTFATQTANDFIEIMLCIGGQEVTWSTQQYTTGATAMTELVDQLSTGGSDGSIAIARSTTVGTTTGGFSAVTSAISARHSLIVASFGGPQAQSRSFVALV